MINILKIEDNGLTTHELSVLFSTDVNSGKLSYYWVMPKKPVEGETAL